MRSNLNVTFQKKSSWQTAYLFIGVLLLSFAATAQKDTTRLNLDAIMRRMDTTYPALLQYHEKLKSIDALAQGAKSWMPPTLSLGLDRFNYQPSMWGEQSPMNQAGVMISVEQMIPNAKKLDARQNYLQAKSAPLKYDSSWLKNDLRTRARLYYYERLIAEKKLGILSESEKLLDVLISIAESRYVVNQSDLSTIFKAKAQRAELLNMKAMLNAQISESNIGLNTLMNRETNTIFSIDTAITIKKYAGAFSYDSLLKRSDFLQMDARIYSMKQEQNYMKSFFRPDFGVKVSHMQMLGMPNQFSVMGMMTFPIAPWSSGMYNSEIRAMDYEIEYMVLEKQNMQLMANQMAAEKWNMLMYENQKMSNYDSIIIPSYQDNYDAAFLAYKENTGNFFILLDAWNMLLMKKMEATDQLNRILILQTQYEYEIEN